MTLLALACFSLVSCGPSADELKMAKALERVGQIKRPGFVRLVNLTDEDASLLDRGRQASGSIAAGAHSGLVPIGVGSREVEVRAGAQSTKLNLDLVTNEGMTLILRSGQPPIQVANEPRAPVGAKNVRVAFIDASGAALKEGLKVQAKGLGGTVTISSDEELATVPSGAVTLSGPGLQTTKVNVIDNLAYSLIVLKGSNGKLVPHWLLNTPNEKVQTAASQ